MVGFISVPQSWATRCSIHTRPVSRSTSTSQQCVAFEYVMGGGSNANDTCNPGSIREAVSGDRGALCGRSPPKTCPSRPTPPSAERHRHRRHPRLRASSSRIRCAEIARIFALSRLPASSTTPPRAAPSRAAATHSGTRSNIGVTEVDADIFQASTQAFGSTLRERRLIPLAGGHEFHDTSTAPVGSMRITATS